MNTNQTEILNNLIAICEDGKNFYHDAIDEIQDTQLRTLFQEMETTRKSIIDDLTQEVALHGEKAKSGGTWKGKLHQMYAELKSNFSNDNAATLVEELEETEDRTLKEFQEAVKEVRDPVLSQKISSYCNVMQRTHDKMKNIKNNLIKH